MTDEEMKKRLQEKYPDSTVQVTDLTGTQNHYQVLVVSDAFDGQARIQRQRAVMDAFSDELKTGEVHALTIRAVTQGEKQNG